MVSSLFSGLAATLSGASLSEAGGPTMLGAYTLRTLLPMQTPLPECNRIYDTRSLSATSGSPALNYSFRHLALGDNTSQNPTLCSPSPLHQHQRVRVYLATIDEVWRDPALTPRWNLLRKVLRHCLDKCWHGRNRAKVIRDPTERATALAFVHCQLLMTAPILTAHDHLLYDRTITSSPIHYVVDHFADYQLPHNDSLWLGTWKPEALHACRPPTYQPPASIPYSLIQQFDAVSARLQCELLRSFLRLHALAR